MKKNNNGMRGFIILGILALSIISLYPSWQVHSLQGDEKTNFIKTNPKVANKAINFGLDLAGGTNIVVEIDKSGLKPDEAEDALERSLEIVRNRVDQFGLSEPNITPSGDKRIVADLAGVDAEEARALIGETALLEFKLVTEQERMTQVISAIDQSLRKRAQGLNEESATDSLIGADTVEADTADAEAAEADAEAEKALAMLTADHTVEIEDTAADTTATADTAKADTGKADKMLSADDLNQSDEMGPFSSLLAAGGGSSIREEDIPKAKRILENPAIKALVPRDLEFAWGRGFEELQNGNKVKELFILKRHAEMDGKEIADARPQRVADGLSAGQISVNLTFKGIGPRMFATVTGNNIKRRLAIVLDGQVISAPVIQDRIANGNAQITGLDDMAEAKQLAVVLRAGALPAPMKIIELRSVGATLGEDNINSGINAMLLGMALVVLFMIIYYMKSGMIAVLALLFNVIIIGAVMSMFNATLTLPGIAGIILTIGMAVDANVIIFERIREELAAGKTARSSIAAGYEKAYSTILDANITTFLTAFILYKIGSGPIKGFGLTLMIGILASLFTALTVTRYVFDVTLKDNSTNKMSIGKGFKFLNEAKYQIIPNAKPFAMVSAALVIVSLLLLPTKGLNFGIDFTGGHVVTVQFEEGVTTESIRQSLQTEGMENAIVRTLGEDNRFLISLQSDENEQFSASESVQKALQAEGHSFEVINEDIVGPSIGSELRSDAIWAIFWSLFIIILYIWVRFGKHGLGFGVGAVVALAHDVTITLGIFALLGLEFDAAVIAALLTIVGYSLNDTIVVFDRIRENTLLLGRDTFDNRVNLSINQSLSRTAITSITTLLVVLVLVVLGGSSIQDFSIAMTIGVLVGTYSSIFVASPFITWWTHRYGLKK